MKIGGFSLYNDIAVNILRGKARTDKEMLTITVK